MLNQERQAAEARSGYYLSELLPGDELDIETENRAYHLINAGHGEGFLPGHPAYCPESLLVTIRGSGYGENMLRANFIGEGLHLEFWHPTHSLVMTSRILAVRRAPKSLPATPSEKEAKAARHGHQSNNEEISHVT